MVESHIVFMVQPYQAKPHRLVALPAQMFDDEVGARRAGSRLARYRAGVVVLAQSVDLRTAAKSRPVALAIHGSVPDGWVAARAA